jgi:hypothetical protein
MKTASAYIAKAESILTENGFEPDRTLRIRNGSITNAV